MGRMNGPWSAPAPAAVKVLKMISLRFLFKPAFLRAAYKSAPENTPHVPKIIYFFLELFSGLLYQVH